MSGRRAKPPFAAGNGTGPELQSLLRLKALAASARIQRDSYALHAPAASSCRVPPRPAVHIARSRLSATGASGIVAGGGSRRRLEPAVQLLQGTAAPTQEGSDETDAEAIRPLLT